MCERKIMFGKENQKTFSSGKNVFILIFLSLQLASQCHETRNILAVMTSQGHDSAEPLLH